MPMTTTDTKQAVEKRRLTFSGAQHLARWLTGADAGRKILSEIYAEELEQAVRADKRLVLVVLDSEGLAEVYTGRGVAVAVRQLLAGDDADRTLREEYLRLTLPRGLRRLYRLSNLATVERYKAIQPEAELEAVNRKAELTMLKESGLWPPRKGKK